MTDFATVESFSRVAIEPILILGWCAFGAAFTLKTFAAIALGAPGLA